MDDPSTTTANLDQADEETLTYNVSDETLEAAAGTKAGTYSYGFVTSNTYCPGCC